jgi:hypothetical protein
MVLRIFLARHPSLSGHCQCQALVLASESVVPTRILIIYSCHYIAQAIISRRGWVVPEPGGLLFCSLDATRHDTDRQEWIEKKRKTCPVAYQSVKRPRSAPLNGHSTSRNTANRSFRTHLSADSGRRVGPTQPAHTTGEAM